MPIVNEILPSVYPSAINPLMTYKNIEEEPQSEVVPMNEWPALSPEETLDGGKDPMPSLRVPATMSLDESEGPDNEWENLSSDSTSTQNTEGNANEEENPKAKVQAIVNPKSFHRCASTPEFSKLQDEDSYVLDCSVSSVEALSVVGSDTVLLTARKVDHYNAMKKVPSFKDIIMLNAQAREEEDRKQKDMLLEQQDRLRREATQRRKKSRPRLVVNPIKRCAKSTGDLRSMVIVEEEDDGCYGGGGGGSGGIIEEEEVLGDTDASEFYSRKQKGSNNRKNGQKLRPDEAKRKNYIIHKKEAQRRAQQQR